MTATAIKERPILFSAPMVRAILAGKKTQTRRIIKNADYYACLTGDCPHDTYSECLSTMLGFCPYGKPGDRLWVKEDYSLSGLGEVTEAARENRGCKVICHYLADDSTASVQLTASDVQKLEHRKSDRHRPQPGRFMYRSCSRILYEITKVRCQRLLEITEADATAEGVEEIKVPGIEYGIHGDPVQPKNCGATNRDRFLYLWGKLNGQESLSENPQVWPIDFKILQINSTQPFKRS